jgi:hypothetical protein
MRNVFLAFVLSAGLAVADAPQYGYSLRVIVEDVDVNNGGTPTYISIVESRSGGAFVTYEDARRAGENRAEEIAARGIWNQQTGTLYPAGRVVRITVSYSAFQDTMSRGPR